MAIINWIFDTKTGSATIGKLRATATPRSGTTSGHVAFGVTAPNGAALKTINPNFATTPASFYDLIFSGTTPQTVDVANLVLDSNGQYMSGIYTLTWHYIFNGTFPGPTTIDTSIDTVTYQFLLVNTEGSPNAPKLTSSVNSSLSQLYINDLTDYTGVTILSHTIASTPIAGGTTVTVTGYVQTLTLAAYTSILRADAEKTVTTNIGNVTIYETFTITQSINSPTDYSTYKNVIDRANIELSVYENRLSTQKFLSDLDRNDWLFIMSKTTILIAKKSLGYDITGEVTDLNNVLK